MKVKKESALIKSNCERGNSMATRAHLEGNKRYHEKLDEIKIRVSKGKKQIIQDVAMRQHESVNKYIVTAIKTRIKIDTGNDVEL